MMQVQTEVLAAEIAGQRSGAKWVANNPVTKRRPEGSATNGCVLVFTEKRPGLTAKLNFYFLQRAAQLREAQRAYRQRKNEKTKGMEEKLTEKTRELRAANERISFLELQLASRQDTATAASSAQQHHLMNASAEAQIQMQLHLQRIQEDHQHTLRNLHERIAELESKNAQLSSENNHLTAAASALSAASQSRRPSPPLQLDSTAQPPPTPFQLRLASVDSTPFPNLEFSFPGASSILAASATSTAPPAGSPHALTQSPAPSTFSRHPSPVSLSRVIHPASHFSPSTSSASMQPQTQPSPMLIAGKEGVVSSPSALSDLDSAMLERAELARAELKMVPSLRDCKWVDLMIDMLKRPGKTKKDGARMLNHRHRLLATCNVMDTQCALEIMEKYIGFVAMVASVESNLSPILYIDFRAQNRALAPT
ncbi:hypothetical protein BC830DRAFT_395818 [Chytriomyces sp. MP71]|nr:hypothetical protein BC830DRAFT_395818 [Chytriomyces sp. MP71]